LFLVIIEVILDLGKGLGRNGILKNRPIFP